MNCGWWNDCENTHTHTHTHDREIFFGWHVCRPKLPRKYFFRAASFLTNNAPKSPLKRSSRYFVGLKKNPADFPPNFPQNLPPPKKETHRRARCHSHTTSAGKIPPQSLLLSHLAGETEWQQVLETTFATEGLREHLPSKFLPCVG